MQRNISEGPDEQGKTQAQNQSDLVPNWALLGMEAGLPGNVGLPLAQPTSTGP